MLSKRQIDILRLVAKGLTTPAIANELTLYMSTVDRDVCGLLNFLGVANRHAAVIKALKLGELRLEEIDL